MTASWYALRSKPRKEDVVWRQVLARGFETYYPRLRVQPVNPRSRKIKPYFPGYLFVHIDLEETGLSAFKWMPHTLGLVSFGGEPAVVPENLIFDIRKRIDRINKEGGEVLEGLKPGDEVRVIDGPFRGYEAIFDYKLPVNVRVKILLELLGNQRRVPLEIDSGSIQPLGK